ICIPFRVTQSTKLLLEDSGRGFELMTPSSPYAKRRLFSAIAEHWPEYFMEAAELGLFMISACFFSVLLGYAGSPIRLAVPDPFARRLLSGLAMAATALAIIHSRWGKRSGAHMNPALTLTFLRLRKLEPADAFFYILAQFVGGIGGVAVSSLLLGMAVSDRMV